MKKVLFLDDEKERHDLADVIASDYSVKVYHAYSAPKAKRLLAEQSFDLVCLDHDLGEDGAGTGMTVAREIVGRGLFPLTLIHSWNIPAARSMKGVLSDGGVPVFAATFSAATIRGMFEAISKN